MVFVVALMSLVLRFVLVMFMASHRARRVLAVVAVVVALIVWLLVAVVG